MVRIVGVRFPSSTKVYYFSPGELELKAGDGVIVETVHGQEYGEVVDRPQEVEQTNLVVPLREVIRMASSQDQKMREKSEERVDEAKSIAMKKIAEHGLDMKLVDVDFSFDGNKITFYFTADGRVDFRGLVKDLAGVFRTRIELRQIGVRDEARMVGGLGCCGREVCCRAFLRDFHPVSIKMAKEQSLSLNPTKISGICGRLMCCLQYEQSTYEALRKEMPRIGKEVFTPEGKGTVVATQVIAEKVKVRVPQPDDSYEMFDFHCSEISTEHPVPRRSKEAVLPELEIAESWEAFNLPDELSQNGKAPRRRSGGPRQGRGQGRPRGENREGGAPAERERRAEAGNPENKDAPRRRRRGGRGRKNGAGQGQNGAQPSATAQAPKEHSAPKAAEPGASGEKKANPRRRRRPRGGGNGNGNGSGSGASPQSPKE